MCYLLALLGAHHILHVSRIRVNIITCMQSVYNYIPETNHVSGVCSVAAVLYLQFFLRVMLFRP